MFEVGMICRVTVTQSRFVKAGDLVKVMEDQWWGLLVQGYRGNLIAIENRYLSYTGLKVKTESIVVGSRVVAIEDYPDNYLAKGATGTVEWVSGNNDSRQLLQIRLDQEYIHHEANGQKVLIRQSTSYRKRFDLIKDKDVPDLLEHRLTKPDRWSSVDLVSHLNGDRALKFIMG